MDALPGISFHCRVSMSRLGRTTFTGSTRYRAGSNTIATRCMSSSSSKTLNGTEHSIRRGTARLQQIGQHLYRPTPPATSSSFLSSSRSNLRPNNIRTMATSIPKTMKGVLVEKTGGVEVLDYKTDLPVPEPKEGEVLVKNERIGINYIDTYFRTGLYPSKKPEILGREAESIVVSSTSDKFPSGTRVVWMGFSAYAEYTAVPVSNLFAVPSWVPSGLAAASILQGLTTLTLIDEAHHVKSGDWVLVHAAAGGVGQWLVQALAARGAHTIATASTDEKRALAKKLGAEVTVGYGLEEIKKAVDEATGGKGVVATLDGVGKDTFDTDLEVLARKGTLVSFGNASGQPAPLTIARLSAKNLKVVRPTLFNYLATEEERETYSKELWELIESKKVEVGIHKTYPLSEIRQAHTDLEGRKTTGKLLLDPSK